MAVGPVSGVGGQTGDFNLQAMLLYYLHGFKLAVTSTHDFITCFIKTCTMCFKSDHTEHISAHTDIIHQHPPTHTHVQQLQDHIDVTVNLKSY